MNAPNKPLAPFTPVQLRPRHDGWTAERQIAFIEKLADSGSVEASCRHVGMSRESAYELRRRPCGRSFRDAWDAAVDCSYAQVEESAAERSRIGVPRPIFYKGEQVGEWRHFDERLTMFLLRYRRARRFGAALDRETMIVDCEEALDRAEPEVRLDGCLDAIECDFGPPLATSDGGPDESSQ